MLRILIASVILATVLIGVRGVPITTVHAQEDVQSYTEGYGPDIDCWPWYKRLSGAGIVVIFTLLLMSICSMATSLKMAFKVFDARKRFLKQQLDKIVRLKKRDQVQR